VSFSTPTGVAPLRALQRYFFFSSACVHNTILQPDPTVHYHDPNVPRIRHNGYQMQGEPDLDAVLAVADCVAVVVTDHSSYNWAAIRQRVRLIVDTMTCA